MKIYIPTLGRINNQKTLENLPTKYQKMVTLVVQLKESKPMMDLYGGIVKNFMVVDDDIGIAKTREEICRSAGKDRFYMIDDDVILYRRNQKYFKDYGEKSNMDTTNKKITESSEIDYMFDVFNCHLNEPNVMCVGHRPAGLPPLKKSWSENVLVHGAVYIDGKKLSKIVNDINWTLCEYAEDVNFNFEYLSRGFKNIRSDEFLGKWDVYTIGGVNDKRDKESYYREHEKLRTKWQKYVTRKSEIVKRNIIGEIHDYKYNLRLAYKDSQT